MTILNKVVICGKCDGGVFMRCVGDLRSCSCEYLTIDDGVVSCADDLQDYRIEEAVPFKQTDAALQADFDECNDRFGLFKSGTKMVAHLRSGKVVVKSVRRGYFDDAEGQLALEA